MIALMMAAEMMGAKNAKVVHYANSGDVSGDKTAVVGYLAAILYKNAEKVYEINENAQTYSIGDEDSSVDISPASSADFGLSENDKMLLLKLAHESITAALKGDRLRIDKSKYTGVLQEERGAFVTLTIGGRLRGCIGYIKAVKPLAETIAEMAVQAAFHDPRFPSLTEEEFKSVDIEISVLTPMTIVENPEDIIVGRDGLYIVRDLNSGILLPQVPVENGWERETFLDQTCLKAGLAPGTWKKEGTQIYKFQADIFGGK